MMISPGGYAKMHENDSLSQLIKERKSLQREIASLEKLVFEKEKTSDGWMIMPGPDVRYRVCLEYLAEICHLIVERYREELFGEEEE